MMCAKSKCGAEGRLPFEIQGHRGARGLKPENTLPSFEAALDQGVTSIETDVHLTRDGVPVLTHDPFVSGRLFRLVDGSRLPPPSPSLLVSSLTFAQLKDYRADRNPEPRRFPSQDKSVTPLAQMFAEARGIHPYSLPSLGCMLEFVADYAADEGTRSGKTQRHRESAQRLRFDLELKRVPFHTEAIGDEFDGERPGRLEQSVVEAICRAGLVERTTVRSFDHRSVRAALSLEPGLTGALLVSGMAPLDPGELARQAGASVYCPDFEFLDERQVKLAHVATVRVLPWTVNESNHWRRMLDWQVDGITTDFPDRLTAFLSEKGVALG